MAKVGYSSSLVFYDAMLPEVTTDARMDNVSSQGYACMAIGSVIHAVGVYSTLARVWGGHSPLAFFRGMGEAMMIAFTTCSSAGTLPVNMKNVQEKLGVSREVTSFVLPLGATINMDGTSVYMGVCSLFIANVFGIDLSFGQMAMIVLTGTLASIGTAGVPGAESFKTLARLIWSSM